MAFFIRQDEAISIIGPIRLGRILDCIEHGWCETDKIRKSGLPTMSLRAMADFIHEYAIEGVRCDIADLPGVHIHDPINKGRFLLEIDRKILIQFRKLDRDFLTNNNPTETSIRFDRQQLTDGTPPLPRLTAGYQVGQYATMLAGIWLAFVVGHECLWHVDLRTGERSTELNFPPSEEGAADQETREEEDERRKYEDGEAEEEGA